MSVISFALQRPLELDIESLHYSTRSSADLLDGLFRLKIPESLGIFRELFALLSKYAHAVQQGTEAAEIGYTAAGEVIDLCEYVRSESYDPEEIQQYLVGMVRLANRSREKAMAAVKMLNAVERELDTLLSSCLLELNEANENNTITEYESIRLATVQLQEGVHTFELFRSRIADLIDWWTWIIDNETFSCINFSTLRDDMIISSWKSLKAQYVDYVHVVSQLKVRYPQVFNEQWGMSEVTINRNAMYQLENDLPDAQQNLQRPRIKDITGRLHRPEQALREIMRGRLFSLSSPGEQETGCRCVIS
ncbi:hypothetical protein BDQ17DRAFT_1545989 [Cyathus striatus]|nr:hypothetical protein BDQ17DRAFT_1545989 [Cyathus striatus]